VDLCAEYEAAKNDYMCPVELRKFDLKETTTQHFANKEFSDVLVIVTGGTLIMTQTPQGYQPARGLAQRLKAYSTFYDQDFIKN
jgi:60kDa lysophospholipase